MARPAISVFSFIPNTYRCPFSPVILSLFENVAMKGTFSFLHRSDTARAVALLIVPTSRSTFSLRMSSFAIVSPMSGLNLSSRVTYVIFLPSTPPFALIFSAAILNPSRTSLVKVVAGPEYVSTNPTLMVSPAMPDPAMQNVDRTTARNDTIFLIASPLLWNWTLCALLWY